MLIDDDVIQVDCNSLQPFQHLDHLSLEDLGWTGNPKRKMLKTISSKQCDEGGKPLAFSVKWICQIPEAASSVEKIVEPFSWTFTSSDVGRMNLLTALFSFMSIQIRAFPDFFWIGTIAAHRSVGSGYIFLHFPQILQTTFNHFQVGIEQYSFF